MTKDKVEKGYVLEVTPAENLKGKTKESPTDLTINLYELKNGVRDLDKTGKHFKQTSTTKSLWLWYSQVISNRGQIDKIQVKIDALEKQQSYIEKENYSIWESFEDYMERNKLKDSANVMFNVVGRLVLTENKVKLEKQIDKLTKEMGKIKDKKKHDKSVKGRISC